MGECDEALLLEEYSRNQGHQEFRVEWKRVHPKEGSIRRRDALRTVLLHGEHERGEVERTRAACL
jgi:hypothetical protein